MSGFSFPLTPLEKQIKTHAILCTTGFLILLPIGALVARYARIFTHKWFWVHAIWQFLIAGPIIFAGWALGYKSTVILIPATGGHFNDPHKKNGLALLILYLVQFILGFVIHFFKPSWFNGLRPPQNYVHAVLGLIIFALAAYQVHFGLYTEWLASTGGLHMVPMSAKNAWMALVIIFWILYGLGLILLPRQYKQEREMRKSSKDDEGMSLRETSSSRHRA